MKQPSFPLQLFFIAGILFIINSCEIKDIIRITKIRTLEASDVQVTSAKGNGEFIDIGNSIEDYGFCYNTSGNPDLNDSYVHASANPTKAPFEATIDNLNPETKYYVRAYAVSDGETIFGDEVDFTTGSASITVTSPTSSDSWIKGSTYDITWTDNFDDDVLIELWRNGETNMYRQVTGAVSSNGSYNWKIPNDLPVESGWRIKVIYSEDEDVYSFSDAFALLQGPTINILTPTTGSKWGMGTTYQINWTDDITENVKTSLLKSGTTYLDIATSTESDGTYDWPIPNNGSISAASDYQISITSVDDPTLYAISSDFEITEQQPISITEPNSASDWEKGLTKTITWTDALTENVKIELFKNDVLVATYGTISADTPSDGTFSWLIPTELVAGIDYSIKITSVTNNTVFAKSEEFTISNEKGTVTDADNNEYQTVKIGNQWWMAENLKVTQYSNGTPITKIEDNATWGALGDNNTDKAFCYYENSDSNRDIYGALYTWAAAMNGASSSNSNPSGIQGVCPTGWHLPSEAEWAVLYNFLGGYNVAGGKLKATGDLTAGDGLWEATNVGATNESGFSAIPGGYRGSGQGLFSDLSIRVWWWTSYQADASNARRLYLENSDARMHFDITSKSAGFYVRCVKD